MSNYPDVAGKIVRDYMERVESHLGLVPGPEREEFLREVDSHLYEAYQRMPGEDDVARILAVLRNFGEPAEAVSDRLPKAMMNSGMKRNLPLHIVAGILIALFGIPLGFGGVAVLAGILMSLAGMVVAYFTATASLLMAGMFFFLLALVRMYQPDLWDRLISLGVIQMDKEVALIVEEMTPAGQGFLLILFACVFIGAGLGMLWLGKHLMRGLRFLLVLAFDRLGKLARNTRRKLRASGWGPMRPWRAHSHAENAFR